jgi:hypothetical protein
MPLGSGCGRQTVSAVVPSGQIAAIAGAGPHASDGHSTQVIPVAGSHGSSGHEVTNQPQMPEGSRSHIGPATLPSAQMIEGAPGAGPHSSGVHAAVPPSQW